MKKLIVLGAFVVTASLTSCGNKSAETEATETATDSIQVEEVTPATPDVTETSVDTVTVKADTVTAKQ